MLDKDVNVQKLFNGRMNCDGRGVGGNVLKENVMVGIMSWLIRIIEGKLLKGIVGEKWLQVKVRKGVS